MQPYLPSVPDPLSDGMNAETLGQGKGWESPWKLLRKGELTYERVWGAYRANLNYVLDEVELLLKNVDAERTVILTTGMLPVNSGFTDIHVSHYRSSDRCRGTRRQRLTKGNTSPIFTPGLMSTTPAIMWKTDCLH